jgi:Probable cobalt transporter subunit (CbtA)
MVGNLIIRGIIVGIVAGLLAFGWAKTFGEGPVNTAIKFEQSQDEAKAAAAVAAGKPAPADDPEIFSRTVQSGIGLFTGVVAIGAGLGGMFAVMFAFAYGRLGALGARSTSALLAVLGLVTIYVVPALKYPANPPSVGEPDTIKLRTGLYFLMMAISLAATIGALLLRRNLARRADPWNATMVAVGAYLVVIAAAFLLLPGINEVPAAFPAVTLWQFRVASLGIQTVLWMSLGVLFGYVGGQVVTRAQTA